MSTLRQILVEAAQHGRTVVPVDQPGSKTPRHLAGLHVIHRKSRLDADVSSILMRRNARMKQALVQVATPKRRTGNESMAQHLKAGGSASISGQNGQLFLHRVALQMEKSLGAPSHSGAAPHVKMDIAYNNESRSFPLDPPHRRLRPAEPPAVVHQDSPEGPSDKQARGRGPQESIISCNSSPKKVTLTRKIANGPLPQKPSNPTDERTTVASHPQPSRGGAKFPLARPLQKQRMCKRQAWSPVLPPATTVTSSRQKAQVQTQMQTNASMNASDPSPAGGIGSPRDVSRRRTRLSRGGLTSAYAARGDGAAGADVGQVASARDWQWGQLAWHTQLRSYHDGDGVGKESTSGGGNGGAAIGGAARDVHPMTSIRSRPGRGLDVDRHWSGSGAVGSTSGFHGKHTPSFHGAGQSRISPVQHMHRTHNLQTTQAPTQTPIQAPTPAAGQSRHSKSSQPIAWVSNRIGQQSNSVDDLSRPSSIPSQLAASVASVASVQETAIASILRARALLDRDQDREGTHGQDIHEQAHDLKPNGLEDRDTQIGAVLPAGRAAVSIGSNIDGDRANAGWQDSYHNRGRGRKPDHEHIDASSPQQTTSDLASPRVGNWEAQGSSSDTVKYTSQSAQSTGSYAGTYNRNAPLQYAPSLVSSKSSSLANPHKAAIDHSYGVIQDAWTRRSMSAALSAMAYDSPWRSASDLALAGGESSDAQSQDRSTSMQAASRQKSAGLQLLRHLERRFQPPLQNGASHDSSTADNDQTITRKAQLQRDGVPTVHLKAIIDTANTPQHVASIAEGNHSSGTSNFDTRSRPMATARASVTSSPAFRSKGSPLPWQSPVRTPDGLGNESSGTPAPATSNLPVPLSLQTTAQVGSEVSGSDLLNTGVPMLMPAPVRFVTAAAPPIHTAGGIVSQGSTGIHSAGKFEASTGVSTSPRPGNTSAALQTELQVTIAALVRGTTSVYVDANARGPESGIASHDPHRSDGTTGGSESHRFVRLFLLPDMSAVAWVGKPSPGVRDEIAREGGEEKVGAYPLWQMPLDTLTAVGVPLQSTSYGGSGTLEGYRLELWSSVFSDPLRFDLPSEGVRQQWARGLSVLQSLAGR